jgi:hypothetical protein
MSSEKGSVDRLNNLGWAVGQVLSDYKLSIRDICHVTNFGTHGSQRYGLAAGLEFYDVQLGTEAE